MLNVDWFNPFKNTEYSLGAVYAVFLNIPPKLRTETSYKCLSAANC